MTEARHIGDVEAIKRIRAAIEEAENQGDAPAFGRLFAEDIAMVPTSNRIDGAEAVEEFHRAMYERTDLEVHFTIEHIEVSGDLAVEYGSYTYDSQRHDGSHVSGEGRYLYTYERDQNNEWRIHRMAW